MSSRPPAFAAGEATLSAEDQARVGALGRELGSGMPWVVELGGGAAPGELPALALRRAQAVRDVLGRPGPRVQVLVRAATDVHAARVDVRVTRPAGQRIVLHEAGHMFGLGDEYVEPPGSGVRGLRAGDAASHSGLAQQAWRGRGVARQGGHFDAVTAGADPASIMAGGMELRPHHYVGFLAALAQLTGTSPGAWEIDTP